VIFRPLHYVAGTPVARSRRERAASAAFLRTGLLALAVGCWAAVPSPASAQLFADNEARRAIIDLRAQVEKQAEEARAAAAQREAALNEQIAQLRRSVLELNTTIESLRREMATLRGQDEQLAREIADLQRKVKDLQDGVDTRIRKLEPIRVEMDGREFLAEPEEQRQFEAALAVFRAGDFPGAAANFGAFLRRWPASGYKDASLFWLGNAQYAKREYRESIATFRQMIAGAPTHPKAPEALLAIANNQIELKDRAGARRTLDELIKGYPNSEAAVAARERITSLR
jgi:tol-pal system protein YbgF